MQKGFLAQNFVIVRPLRLGIVRQTSAFPETHEPTIYFQNQKMAWMCQKHPSLLIMCPIPHAVLNAENCELLYELDVQVAHQKRWFGLQIDMCYY